MSSCTCPACFKYPPYRSENFGWGLASPKATQLEDQEKSEEQTQLEQPLSPSPYNFFSMTCFSNMKQQSWGNDSLFTFNKYTVNVSTGISSTSMPTSIPKRSSSPASSSSDDSGDNYHGNESDPNEENKK